MKQGCKVYKRAGITHVCYKGFHYAPKAGEHAIGVTSIGLKDRVLIDVSVEPDAVAVQQGSTIETWVKTVIGGDNPNGYALTEGKVKSPKKAKEPTEEKVDKKSGAILKLLTPELREAEKLPSDEDVDKMLALAAPNPDALAMMRVCWSNWLMITVKGNRNLVPFSEFNYEQEEDTLRVHLLGARLADVFKGVYSR